MAAWTKIPIDPDMMKEPVEVKSMLVMDWAALPRNRQAAVLVEVGKSPLEVLRSWAHRILGGARVVKMTRGSSSTELTAKLDLGDSTIDVTVMLRPER
jgi:hypothetical protein